MAAGRGIMTKAPLNLSGSEVLLKLIFFLSVQNHDLIYDWLDLLLDNRFRPIFR